MSIEPDEEEFPEEFEGDDWTRRVFERYGCASAVGDFEILVYAMLLEHNPQIISPDQRNPPGRPQFWTTEREIWLYDTVERCRLDPSIPEPIRRHPSQTIKRIHREPWFAQQLGRNLSAGTLANVYARGKRAADARKSDHELS